jgi:TrmH family RNA methyltransferase
VLPNDRDRLCVILVRTRNPLNIGAAARAMSNFGFSQLRVVQPYEIAFREARSAVGAAELLKNAEEYGTIAEAVSDCRLVVGTTAIGKRQLQQPVRTLETGAKMIRKRLGSGRVAILFGSEKTGLSNEDLSHCHWVLHIPTRPEHLSMNLAQAVAATLYELSRDAGRKPPQVRPPLATAAELERLTQALAEAATRCGFFTEESTASREQKLRRLIRRLDLQPDDAQILLAIVRQVLWKLKA